MGFWIQGDIVLGDSSIPGFSWIKVVGLSMGDKIVVLSMSVFARVSDYNEEVKNDDCECNNIKDGVSIHNNLSLLATPYCPEINNQGQYAGSNIKMEKSHNFFSAILDTFAAMVINPEVRAMPPMNVNHGILPEAEGINTPTTNEPNMILAPSRKKSETTFNSSFSNIQSHTNIREDFVKYFIDSDISIDEVVSIK